MENKMGRVRCVGGPYDGQTFPVSTPKGGPRYSYPKLTPDQELTTDTVSYTAIGKDEDGTIVAEYVTTTRVTE